MNRLELFKDALVRTQKLLREHPYMIAPKLIEVQLNYLIGLEEGTHNDKSKLKDIIVGILSVREIEGVEQELAEMLHEIQWEVDNMIKR